MTRATRSPKTPAVAPPARRPKKTLDVATTITLVDSPLGEMQLVSNGKAILAIDLIRPRGRAARRSEGIPDQVTRRAAKQLEEYFAGARQSFQFPLEPVGTPFQRAVWRALLEIPYAERRTYADIARRIGKPRATRAVGAAIGRNPVWIVIPCHRVIGSDGTLTGYAGGIEVKKWLLNHEDSNGE